MYQYWATTVPNRVILVYLGYSSTRYFQCTGTWNTNRPSKHHFQSKTWSCPFFFTDPSISTFRTEPPRQPNNWIFTSTETLILYGTYGIYRPICYRTHIFSIMEQVYHMVHMGWICLDITVRTFYWQWDTHTIWWDTGLIFPVYIM